MANLWLPDKMSEIVNNGIIKQDMSAIWNNGLMMILVTATGGFCSIVVGFLAARIATGMAQKLRLKLFERIESFSLADFNKFSTASLITRSTNDIQQIQTTSIMLLRLALMAPIMAIGGLQKAMNNAPRFKLDYRFGGVYFARSYRYIILRLPYLGLRNCRRWWINLIWWRGKIWLD